MEHFIIGIVVGSAALFIFNRFRNYVKAAKFDGPGCCGSCGCRATKDDIKLTGAQKTTEELVQLSKAP